MQELEVNAMPSQQDVDPQETSSASKNTRPLEALDPRDRKENEEHIVEYGSATKLTKGRGGRRSEQGYSMP